MLLAGEDAEITATILQHGACPRGSDLGQPIGGSGGHLRRRTHRVDRLGCVDLVGGRLGLSSFRGTFLSTLPTPAPALVSVSGCDNNALVCTTP